MQEHRKVLIIDDEIDLSLLLQSYLTRKGYDVHITHTIPGNRKACEHRRDRQAICRTQSLKSILHKTKEAAALRETSCSFIENNRGYERGNKISFFESPLIYTTSPYKAKQ